MPLIPDTKLGKPKRRGLAPSGGVAAAFDPSSVAGLWRDWNFADVTKLFTDVAHTTPVTADADTIGAVLDTAGSGVYLVAPADDTTRPLYKTAIQNSLSVARLDGSNDRFQAVGGISADTSQTIFIVARKRSAASSTGMYFWFETASASIYVDTDNSPGFTYASAQTALGGTVNNWNIVCLKVTSAASLTAYINGGAGTTLDPHDDVTTATDLYLGASDGGAAPGDWDFGRVLIYSGALSDTDNDYITSGLGTLWNISTTTVS
jgi:hypothetical protein